MKTIEESEMKRIKSWGEIEEICGETPQNSIKFINILRKT
jgi:hypothetical protein